ncbi:hypothetical protein MNEG_8877 [Monoraphidium neglectum]|uniref:Uncharacterized protein n=1 Tax=Monoraphidium neglectum TaxID=145388 RepID=A0A0D2MEF0_9CHLO|nr:hypothetical protein MNEG_8877 [Monoraphidium neglectum]KIY99086.1 hypothetical protein MNEG_8877 [Monoraphidium neglectum]|eukprot:XP_013898106.1 hypothetical protein MNEG_8877 [Monoraphidium neglectum]
MDSRGGHSSAFADLTVGNATSSGGSTAAGGPGSEAEENSEFSTQGVRADRWQQQQLQAWPSQQQEPAWRQQASWPSQQRQQQQQQQQQPAYPSQRAAYIQQQQPQQRHVRRDPGVVDVGALVSNMRSNLEAGPAPLQSVPDAAPAPDLPALPAAPGARRGRTAGSGGGTRNGPRAAGRLPVRAAGEADYPVPLIKVKGEDTLGYVEFKRSPLKLSLDGSESVENPDDSDPILWYTW